MAHLKGRIVRSTTSRTDRYEPLPRTTAAVACRRHLQLYPALLRVPITRCTSKAAPDITVNGSCAKVDAIDRL